MKKTNILLLAFSMILANCFAQNSRVEHTRSLDRINVVVLSLSGNTSIQGTMENELKTRSLLITKGGVWGFKYPESRPEFKTVEYVLHDTLFVSTPARFDPHVIGIDTYSESIENTIQLPADKKIIITRADQLELENDWKYINVCNANQLKLTIHKASIGTLSCRVSKSLKINGQKSSSEYVMNGIGPNIYSLQANQVSLNIR